MNHKLGTRKLELGTRNFLKLLFVFLFLFIIHNSPFIIHPVYAQVCKCTTAAPGTLPVCLQVSTCTNITFDSCIDELGQTGSLLCTGGASGGGFRCYASANINCQSNGTGNPNVFNYSCSTCTGPPPPPGGGGGGQNINIPVLKYGYTSIGLFITNVLTVLYVIAILVVLFMLVWGAYEWITSGGNKESVNQARGRIIGALVGLAILAIVFALAAAAGQFLGFNNITSFTVPAPG